MAERKEDFWWVVATLLKTHAMKDLRAVEHGWNVGKYGEWIEQNIETLREKFPVVNHADDVDEWVEFRKRRGESDWMHRPPLL